MENICMYIWNQLDKKNILQQQKICLLRIKFKTMLTKKINKNYKQL